MTVLQPTRRQQMRTGRLLDESIPVLIQPLIRAYLLGYASSTVPRLLTLSLTHLSNRTKSSDSEEGRSFWPSLRNTLLVGLEWQRFPTFCALLIGGSTAGQIPLRRLFARFLSKLPVITQERFIRCLSSFIAAWLGIAILQSKESVSYTNMASSSHNASERPALRSTKLAGRTIDLTLFAVTRAVDVIVGEIWDRRRTRRIAARKWTEAEAAISSLADSGIFASSCALIMWCWVYLPERLPRAYNRWIAGAAAVDVRLVTALKACRSGDFIYGQDTGQAPLLRSMCVDFHWPEIWGDPAKTIPIPCEIVHMGTGNSCEYHAFRRFLKGFLMAGGMYGPINLALQLRNPSKEGMKRATISSIRSSAFLGSFIALFYYGVCLARTRVGPHVIGTDMQSRQKIDSGICVGSGCMLCGWSLLLENAGRRKDIALFVAPRALATLLPRKYDMKHQWKESMLFAASTAIVFTCVQENPARVRGMLGKLLPSIMAQ